MAPDSQEGSQHFKQLDASNSSDGNLEDKASNGKVEDKANNGKEAPTTKNKANDSEGAAATEDEIYEADVRTSFQEQPLKPIVRKRHGTEVHEMSPVSRTPTGAEHDEIGLRSVELHAHFPGGDTQ